MTETIAGGPLGFEPEPLPEDETQQGVAPPGANDQEAAAATESQTFSQAQLEEMINAAVQERTKGMVSQDDVERQVANVRSSLMRSQNEERNQWAEQDDLYKQQILELTVKDMDDNTRNAFERDLYAQRAAEMEDRLLATQSDLEAARQIGPYLKNLVDGFDIGLDALDLTDIESISNSAYEAASKRHKALQMENAELREKLESLSTVDSTNQPHQRENVGPVAPRVVTDQGQTVEGTPTIYDLRKSISQRMGLDYIISEEQLFEMGERPEETGVDLNVVLRALEAEEQE